MSCCRNSQSHRLQQVHLLSLQHSCPIYAFLVRSGKRLSVGLHSVNPLREVLSNNKSTINQLQGTSSSRLAAIHFLQGIGQ